MAKYIPPSKRNQMESGECNLRENLGKPAQRENQNFEAEKEIEKQTEKKEYMDNEEEQNNNENRDRWSRFGQEKAGAGWGSNRRNIGGNNNENYNQNSANVSSQINNNNASSANNASKLRVVEVDSLVLIKVLKHCKDNYPTAVNGQLLGMDTGDVLEVSNCFPLPQKRDIYNSVSKKGEKDIDERVEEEFDCYQDKLAELMHDLNVDCFTVGWYQTLSFGDLKNKDNIDSLVLYQELVDKAILLGFDPLLSAMGKMAFKGFRVSDEFLAKYHAAEEDVSKYNELKASDILTEVPLVIKNPLLVQAYLTEWAAHDKLHSTTEFDTLELDQNNYLEKNLLFISDCLDELGIEQEKLSKYNRDFLRQQLLQKQIIERRRVENEQKALKGEPLLPMEFDGPAFRKISPPSQINTLLMSNQAAMQCKEIAQISKENLGKMFLLNKTYQYANSFHK